MAKYKVGDKVRIVSERPDDKAFVDMLEAYLGKVLTVNRVMEPMKGEPVYRFREAAYDSRLERLEWMFLESWISGLASEKKSVDSPGSGYRVVLHFIGETTTATLMHGDRAVKYAEAKCNPAGQFQYGEGAKVAVNRLFAKKEKPKKEELKKKEPWEKTRLFIVTGNDHMIAHGFPIGENVLRVGSGDSGIPGVSEYVSIRTGLKQDMCDRDVKPL